jgi:hypothetical protein
MPPVGCRVRFNLHVPARHTITLVGRNRSGKLIVITRTLSGRKVGWVGRKVGWVCRQRRKQV